MRGFEECTGHPIELLPATGESRQADAVRPDGCWEIRTSLYHLGSALFAIPKADTGQNACADAGTAPLQVCRSEVLQHQAWAYTRTEPNVLVLDRPAYRVENANWAGPQNVLRVDQVVRQYLGIPARGGAMSQPWTWDRSAPSPSVQVTLHYELTVDTPPGAPLYLAVEHPERFRIQLNHHEVDSDTDCGWWVDPSLRCLPLDPAHLTAGTNDLWLDCSYHPQFSGLETVYMLGEFGVTVDGSQPRITALPATLKPGNIVSQGLPFYSGNLTYTTRIHPELEPGERLFIQVQDYEAVAVRILIDGREAGVIAWPPNELELTPLVRNGQPADLGIQVLGHRRNSHGPLHLPENRPRFTGPNSFIPDDEHWQEEYNTVAIGLMTPPSLMVKRGT